MATLRLMVFNSDASLLSPCVEVDIEGLGFTPAEMDSSGSGSDAEDSLQGSSSDSGYARPHRRHARLL